MKTLNLVLHCGANAVEREAISAVHTPPPTETWHPIPHDRLIEQVESALDALDLEVVKQAHALTRDGLRYFGLMQVDRKQSDGIERDYAFVAGLRNSHDKSFPAGLVVGDGVFICDNLSFSGEVQFARRHTSRIMQDLPILTTEAVAKLQHGWTKTDARVEAYKNFELDTKSTHDLVIKALDMKAITTQQVPRVLEEYRNPRHDEFKARTVWSLFNSFTETMKATSLVELPRRTIRLEGILDGVCDIANSDVVWN
jgi:Domain of unknown function (DUF932)